MTETSLHGKVQEGVQEELVEMRLAIKRLERTSNKGLPKEDLAKLNNLIKKVLSSNTIAAKEANFLSRMVSELSHLDQDMASSRANSNLNLAHVIEDYRSIINDVDVSYKVRVKALSEVASLIKRSGYDLKKIDINNLPEANKKLLQIVKQAEVSEHSISQSKLRVNSSLGNLGRRVNTTNKSDSSLRDAFFKNNYHNGPSIGRGVIATGLSGLGLSPLDGLFNLSGRVDSVIRALATRALRPGTSKDPIERLASEIRKSTASVTKSTDNVSKNVNDMKKSVVDKVEEVSDNSESIIQGQRSQLNMTEKYGAETVERLDRRSTKSESHSEEKSSGILGNIFGEAVGEVLGHKLGGGMFKKLLGKIPLGGLAGGGLLSLALPAALGAGGLFALGSGIGQVGKYGKGVGLFHNNEGSFSLLDSKFGAYGKGALGGAATGAAIGSVVPVIGTAIGAIVGGVLGTGSVFIADHWKEIKKFTSKTIDGFKSLVGAGVDKVSGIFSTIADKLGIVPLFIEDKVITPIKDAFDKVSNGIVGMWKFLEGLPVVGKFFKAAGIPLGIIANTVSQTASTVAHTAENVGESVARTAGKVAKGAGDLSKKAMQSLDELVKGGDVGVISAKYESGGRGAGTISTGQGDAGGASYGTHQLSSKTGTLQDFLRTSGYSKEFSGLTPGSAAFNAKWKELAKNDPKFGKSQSDFIAKTHYAPQMDKLVKNGIDLTTRGRAVKEAIYSTSVQYGGNTGLIVQALKGKDVSKMSDADIVSAIQDYKAATVETKFRSSSAKVRAGVADRIQREKKDLIAIATDPNSKNVTSKDTTANAPSTVASTAVPITKPDVPAVKVASKAAAPVPTVTDEVETVPASKTVSVAASPITGTATTKNISITADNVTVTGQVSNTSPTASPIGTVSGSMITPDVSPMQRVSASSKESSEISLPTQSRAPSMPPMPIQSQDRRNTIDDLGLAMIQGFLNHR